MVSFHILLVSVPHLQMTVYGWNTHHNTPPLQGPASVVCVSALMADILLSGVWRVRLRSVSICWIFFTFSNFPAFLGVGYPKQTNTQHIQRS